MGTPFLGEIKILAFSFAPQGWAECNGQFLPINQNQALFSILGTSFGGNGQTTFALPDFRGRAPIGGNGSYIVGQAGGQEFHTVTLSEMPAHNHLQTNTASDLPANSKNPANRVPAADPSGGRYATAADTALAPEAVGAVGGSQPHENRQPFLVLKFVIALQGVFPSRN